MFGSTSCTCFLVKFLFSVLPCLVFFYARGQWSVYSNTRSLKQNGKDTGKILTTVYVFILILWLLMLLAVIVQHCISFAVKDDAVFLKASFAFSTLTLLVLWQEGHLACKSWVLVFWWRWSHWSFACLESSAFTQLPCSHLLLYSNPFWYRLTQVVLEYWVLNEGVCV